MEGLDVISNVGPPVNETTATPASNTILRSLSHWGAFRADIADGRLVGVAPFEHDPHPSDLITVWPEMLTSPLRVSTPVARRGWLAGDKGAARGDDDFVEIGWDRALDLVAGEVSRVRHAFGNAAIFGGSYGWSSAGRLHHARTLLHRFLNCAGGFTGQVTNYSYGAAMTFLPRVLGVTDSVGSALSTWDTIAEHCELLLAFGGIPSKNWEIQAGGTGQHRYADRMEALAGKVRLFNISPLRSDVPALYTSEWVPIRPNTDAALLLALAYHVVDSGRHDRAFLDRHCSGFERFQAYLLGRTDGTPKTAEWAAQITQVPADKIRALAALITGRRVLLTATWSLQRARHGEQPYWAMIALAAVLGQIGLPGGGFAFGYGSSNGMGNPRHDTPLFSLPMGTNPIDTQIPVARIADLLLRPGETIRFNGAPITYPNIRLIYWAGGTPFHHHQDLNRLRRAFKRPDTVIVNECYWTSTARHADIVLPATTSLERNDIGGASRDPFVLAMHKLVKPVGEARNDYDIFAGLAARLGLEQAFTEGKDADQWLRFAWSRISFQLGKRGIDTPGFDAFWEQGYFRVPEPAKPYVMFAGFRADPEGARLPTPSGRIELFCDTIAAMRDPEQPGHPVWNEPEEWLGARLAAQYPIHLLTPQPARKLHGQMDASSLSRAAKRHDREVVLMHAEDARRRGIADGDMVLLFNDRGACLAVAQTSSDVLRGVAWLPTGATFDPDERGFDRHSNPNVLTPDCGTSLLGQGCSAQSCLVEIERFDKAVPPVRIFEPPKVAGKFPDVGEQPQY